MDVHTLIEVTAKQVFDKTLFRLWQYEVTKYMHGADEKNPNDPRNLTSELFVKQVDTIKKIKDDLSPGALIRSFIEGKPHNIAIYSFNNGLISNEYGTDVPYAHRHEAGTYGMPARPFLAPATKEINKTIIPKLIKGFSKEVINTWQYNLKKEYGK